MEPKKKLKLKNATHAHIMADGTLNIGYSERHKTSGKDVQWMESIAPGEVPFKLHLSKYRTPEGFTFRSVYLDNRIMPLLNDLASVELWPVNNHETSSHTVSSVILNLKNGASLSFDKFSENGKVYKSSSVEIL